MIISKENLHIEQRAGERLGTFTPLLTETQMHGKVKIFARSLLKPGSKTPIHRHTGDFEALYILSGRGLVYDNGISKEVKAGDVTFTDDGESHAIENIGDTDLEYIALVIYA